MVLGVSWRSWLAVTAIRRPGREGVEGFARFGRRSDLRRRWVREMPHLSEFRDGVAGNVTLPRTLGLLSGLEKGPQERPAAITVAIAPIRTAARKSLLSNTHESVDFPRSSSRLASPVTSSWEGGEGSVAPPVTRPWRLPPTLPTSPAVSGTVTASQGRDRDGRARRRPLRPACFRAPASNAPVPPRRPPTQKTTVRPPSSSTRSSRWAVTARARTRRSTSRPMRTRSGTSSSWPTRTTSWSMIGPASRSAVT